MKHQILSFILSLLLAFLAASCSEPDSTDLETKPETETFETPAISFAEARKGFETKLIREESEEYEAPSPPPPMFELVDYPSGSLELAAYVSPDPGDGKKHPAIIWIVGGFSNSISETPWDPGPRENDQSGSTFRKAGILMMYPSLRGGNDNPGNKEGFLGEADDVLAAADYLKSLDYIDPERISLGGHSTGGTLVLLAAAAAPENTFRAVVSLGPAGDPANYGAEDVPYDISDERETKLRAPIHWLHSISAPTWILEGEDGNYDSLLTLEEANSNPEVSVLAVPDADHFDIIAPVSEIFAGMILDDTGSELGSKLEPEEIALRLKTIQPPPRKPFPAGDPQDNRIVFEYAVYLPEKTTEEDAIALVKKIAETDFPELKWGNPDDPSSGGQDFMAYLIEDVAETYAPPTLEELEYKGESLSQEQGEALQRSPHAIAIVFRHPGELSIAGLRSANGLLARVAEETGGFPWDEHTRQVFSNKWWKENRIIAPGVEYPDVANHITMHAYRNIEHLRAITLGMEKFGLPDVLVDQFAASDIRSMGNLINSFSQLLVEGAVLETPDEFHLDLREIKNDSARAEHVENLFENATGEAQLALKQGPWDLGDPINRLIEIYPDHYDGPDLFARQHALLSELFGWEDTVTRIESGNPAVEAASAKARSKLPELKRDFSAGLEPGETILIKAPFDVPDGGHEYMWVEIRVWDEESITGSLRSEPFNIPDLKAGQEVTVPVDDIYDYIRRFSDGTDEGNETGKAIGKLQEEAEKAER